MAASGRGTLVNTPRRSRSVVRSRKRSTMFQPDMSRREVHVKRGCLASPCTTGACAWRSCRRSGAAFVLGRLAVDLLEELQPLDVGVALLALADDLAVEHVERRKQCGRASGACSRASSSAPPLLQNRSRLRAIKRLHLALLVAALRTRACSGGTYRNAHDVFELLGKLGSRRTSCAPDAAAVRMPMAHHGAGADAQQRAILRVLQCVIASGLLWVVNCTSWARPPLPAARRVASRARYALMPPCRWRSRQLSPAACDRCYWCAAISLLFRALVCQQR